MDSKYAFETVRTDVRTATSPTIIGTFHSGRRTSELSPSRKPLDGEQGRSYRVDYNIIDVKRKLGYDVKVGGEADEENDNHTLLI